jgi:hypothetical protein
LAARNDLHYASQPRQCLRGDAYPRRTESNTAIALLSLTSLAPAPHRLPKGRDNGVVFGDVAHGAASDH